MNSSVLTAAITGFFGFISAVVTSWLKYRPNVTAHAAQASANPGGSTSAQASANPGGNAPAQVSASSGSRKLAFLIAFSAVVAIGGLAVALFELSESHAAAAPYPRPASAAACPAKLSMSSPAVGAKVPGPSGVLVQAVSCGLTDETGWLFNYDYGAQAYYEVYDGIPGPMITANGNWKLYDSPIGSPGDHDRRYTLYLVLASRECNSDLLKIKPIEGTYEISKIPLSCNIAQNSDVYVTWPK